MRFLFAFCLAFLFSFLSAKSLNASEYIFSYLLISKNGIIVREKYDFTPAMTKTKSNKKSDSIKNYNKKDSIESENIESENLNKTSADLLSDKIESALASSAGFTRAENFICNIAYEVEKVKTERDFWRNKKTEIIDCISGWGVVLDDNAKANNLQANAITKITIPPTRIKLKIGGGLAEISKIHVR